jgi:hypothetical protein
MQRWMLYAGLAVVGLVLLTGGGLYGYREYLRGKPAPIWVPLALRVDISMEDQSKLAKEIEDRLRNGDLLRQAVVDTGLQAKFGSPSEDAAVKELEQRLFVKVGTAVTPEGTVPSINVGVNGTGGEKEILGVAATRIMQDVWKMIGIDPETGKTIEKTGDAPAPMDSVPDLN